MGNVLQDQGRIKEAINFYNKAIAIKPDYGEAWTNLYFPLYALKTKISTNEKINPFYPNDIKSSYAQIELGILDYKLHRGQKSESIYMDKVMSRLSVADNIIIKNPTFQKKAQKTTQISPDKMVALYILEEVELD